MPGNPTTISAALLAAVLVTGAAQAATERLIEEIVVSAQRAEETAQKANISNDTHITGGKRTTLNNGFGVTEPRTYGASVKWNFGAI